ncbi:MAG TPA: transcription termination/antitermination NusG family protein [Phycisphaerae bacterium]|jgi:transcription antitermination factor NusG|nr:transcription termination/antitermination NusG family protein [Phycisphaerae bacterium]
MLSLDENPPIMPAYAAGIDQLRGPWWVAHTKSRCEKAFAWDLHEQEISYFLPMSERTTFSGGRKRKGMTPLFPSYVFFCGDTEACWAAMRTNRLCQVLPVKDQGILVGELAQIHRILMHGEALQPFSGYPIGSKWRVRTGPLQGITGIVVEHKTPARLVLKVSMLGQGTSLDIDADLLEQDAAGTELLEHRAG